MVMGNLANRNILPWKRAISARGGFQKKETDIIFMAINSDKLGMPPRRYVRALNSDPQFSGGHRV